MKLTPTQEFFLADIAIGKYWHDRARDQFFSRDLVNALNPIPIHVLKSKGFIEWGDSDSLSNLETLRITDAGRAYLSPDQPNEDL